MQVRVEDGGYIDARGVGETRKEMCMAVTVPMCGEYGVVWNTVKLEFTEKKTSVEKLRRLARELVKAVRFGKIWISRRKLVSLPGKPVSMMFPNSLD